jgi:uncharacterized membrane protein
MARRGYLDWLRGLAVLVMIEAHVLDSWTRLDERQSALFGPSMIAGGFGAPLFLFLAGVSVSLSAHSKFRRSGDADRASRAVVARGFQIFGLAFLFRLQACILSWGSWRSLLKVDILNIMGPSISAAGAVWGLFRSSRARWLAFLAVTAAFAFLTPPVRAVGFLSALPDPIEGYLRPRPGFTTFAFFPWAGFVFAGAASGVLLADTVSRQVERSVVIRIGIAGALLAAIAFAASYLPSPFARSEFWTSSPAFFFIRTGILTALIGIAYAWEMRPGGEGKWSPLQQLGRTSLFIYWIHVEMVYGLAVRPLHKSMTFGWAWFGVLAFALFMLICSLVKERVAKRWRARHVV